jgi:hypothetical protein
MYDLEADKVVRTSSVKFARDPLREITDVTDSAPPPSPLSTPTPSSTKLLSATPSGLRIDRAPPTPPDSPELSSQVPQTGGEDEEALLQDLQLPAMGKGHNFDGFQPPEAPRYLDISASLDERLIITTKRTRQLTAKAIALVAIPITLRDRTPGFLARCFATAMASAPTIYKHHRSGLLPEPTSHKQALQHVLADGWIDAEGVEY